MNLSNHFTASPVKASNIIGTAIINAEGKDLGNVKEIVIDRATGKVAYIAVAFGGFLGMGEKLFAIPFNAFNYDNTEEKYILNIAREKLESAEGFDADTWPSMSEEKWHRTIHQHYNSKNYWEK